MNSKLQEALDDCNRYMDQMRHTPRFTISPEAEGGYMIYANRVDDPISKKFLYVATVEAAIGAFRAIPNSYIAGWADGVSGKR